MLPDFYNPQDNDLYYGDFGLFSSALGANNDDFWGNYQDDHVYSFEVEGQGQPIDFYVNDINFQDNRGAYTIRVYQKTEYYGYSYETLVETLTVDSQTNVASVGQPKVFSAPLDQGVVYRFEVSDGWMPDYRIDDWYVDARFVEKTTTIATGSGDGGVRVSIDAFGRFGSDVAAGTSDAFYDPVGTLTEAGTVYRSEVAIRVGASGERRFLEPNRDALATFTEVTPTSAKSTFRFAGLNFQLTQTVTDLFAEGMRIGSMLTQTYVITNPGSEAIDFELLRYLDGDLEFDDSIDDSGGRLFKEGQEILFETDSGDNPLDATTFVGITATGGTAGSPGRFEVDDFEDDPNLRDRILAGTELDQIIEGDDSNEIDADEFIDGSAYDVTLAFRNNFVLNPGVSTTYTTTTIFGSGSPESFGTTPDTLADSFANATDLGVLTDSQTVSDAIGGTDAYDYIRFEVTETSRLRLQFRNLSQEAIVTVLDRRGVPVSGVASRQGLPSGGERENPPLSPVATAGSGQDGTFNVDRLLAGVYYLRVFRSAATSTAYQLTVAAIPITPSLQIRSVTPDGGSNTGQTTLTIAGSQFTAAAQVSLVDATGAERAATQVTWLNDKTLVAKFDLTGLPADTFDVRVTDTQGSVTAENAFGVKIGAIGQVEVYLSAPSQIRDTDSDVVTITYRNTGDTDVAEPQLLLEASGALLQKMGETDFTASQIQVSGASSAGLAGILAAGATGRLVVRFQPTATVGSTINFSVKSIAGNISVNESSTGESSISQSTTTVVSSFAPNQMIDPSGVGAAGWIAPSQLLPYSIRFENDATRSTATAAQVAITQQLDPELDLEAFELGEFGFGSIVVNVPNGLQNYSERLDLRSTIGAFVDVEATLNRDTRTVTWTFKTIDPATGEVTTAANAGFLPINNSNGDGEGFVRYLIAPKTELQSTELQPTGSQFNSRIDAQASIVFNANAAIQTSGVSNPIDSRPPTSTVQATPGKGTGQVLNLKVSGQDSGSGIASYDLYVSTDGQPLTRWQPDRTSLSTESLSTKSLSTTFLTAAGHTYRFASAARDQVGNRQAIPTELGNDLIRVGTNRKNRLFGSIGNDGLIGMGGNDRLVGKGKQDTLNGGSGKDTLLGGQDSDTLIGGSGRDIFVLEKGSGRDVIQDFKNGQDRLDLGQGLSLETIEILRRGRHTLVKGGGDPLALLQGVRANQITIADFT